MAVKINAKRLDYLTRERSDSDSRGRFTRRRALKHISQIMMIIYHTARKTSISRTRKFNSFFSVLFGIIRVAGVVLLVFGIYQTFPSSQSHDTTARIQGVFMLGGGLVAFFLREILGFLGIAV